MGVLFCVLKCCNLLSVVERHFLLALIIVLIINAAVASARTIILLLFFFVGRVVISPIARELDRRAFWDDLRGDLGDGCNCRERERCEVLLMRSKRHVGGQ